ncbi:MAG: glycosyltransferase family 4 protein [candidate division Zixibacteria bacterium]|nr:glycosyltransferase family 4 protein [candidate division Zixibacteria bacterium]
MKILLAAANAASFITRDARILRERHEVVEYVLPRALWPSAASRRLVDDCDLLFVWFATVRAWPLVVRARRQGKPIVLVIGGYEVVHRPDLNYGTARRLLHRQATQSVLNRATRVLTVSKSSHHDLLANFQVDPARTKVIPHGFEDLAEGIARPKSPSVLTVGYGREDTWRIKGLEEFFATAAQMPDVSFVHVGGIAPAVLQSKVGTLPPNVKLVGAVPYADIGSYYAPAQVYLQMSRHESFGCAVAESMLFECVPVVSRGGALPEVVGDAGIIVESWATADVVAAIRGALALPSSAGVKARQRVLTEFSYARRRDRLLAVIDEAVAVRHIS